MFLRKSIKILPNYYTFGAKNITDLSIIIFIAANPNDNELVKIFRDLK